MKMNVLRNLVLPWFLFFVLAITATIATTLTLHLQVQEHPLYLPILGFGVFLCLVANIRTFSKAGIWIAHSLPSALRFRKWPWVRNAVIAAVVALVAYLLGQASWMPLFWHAFIIPAVFTISVFVIVWYLMGPILTWSSSISFSRIVAFVFSLPVFILVPFTAFFLGKTIVTAYLASHPFMIVMNSSPDESKSIDTSVTDALKATAAAEPHFLRKDAKLEEKAQILRGLAEGGKTCYEYDKEIQAALVSTGSDESVYWAIRSVKCSDLTSVVALPKLAKIMTDHSSPVVRAAAIRAMAKYGQENVQRIGYLIVKRINEKEAPEVIESAALALSRLGEDERKWAINRLKGLLDNAKINTAAAKILVQDLKQEELVTTYVSENLDGGGSKDRAVELICWLPKASRTRVEPHIQSIVSNIKTGAQDDPAMKALDCLGQPGYQAIRKEVIAPRQLDRPIAARAFAEMKVKSPTEALETVETCVGDSNEQVRKWCSQSLGKIGGPALPKILDLLKSNQAELKDAGKNALHFFEDASAKTELERIRAENSGWFADKKKLQIAEAVNTALMKVESDQQADKKEE